MHLSKERAEELVSEFKNQQILVVGDLMLDRFIYGRVHRISPEAPVPVVEVTGESNMPGGASNVAWNVRALGGTTVVGGFLGVDVAGSELRNMLECGGVSTTGCIDIPEGRTIEKTRVIAENQQVVRVDWESARSVSSQDIAKFCSLLEREAEMATGIIIEDYGKGVVCPEVLETVLKISGERNILTGLDPKDTHEMMLDHVTVATPNRREAFMAAGIPESSVDTDPLHDEALLQAAALLQQKWHPELLAITLGDGGMLLVPEAGEVRHIPTRAREVYDVSGAGDTVIAVCMLALLSGADYREAAELANCAAGVVVGKIGTAPCSHEELLAAVSEDIE